MITKMEEFKSVNLSAYLPPAFDFAKAQEHELRYHTNWTIRNFPNEWDGFNKRKKDGEIDFNVNDYFEGNI